MTGAELYMRCVKARIVSWLNSDKVGATLPLGDGQYVIVAIYENGRYVRPEKVTVPSSLAEMQGWGIDGPLGDVTQVQEPTDEGDDDDENPA